MDVLKRSGEPWGHGGWGERDGGGWGWGKQSPTLICQINNNLVQTLYKTFIQKYIKLFISICHIPKVFATSIVYK